MVDSSLFSLDNPQTAASSAQLKPTVNQQSNEFIGPVKPAGQILGTTDKSGSSSGSGDGTGGTTPATNTPQPADMSAELAELDKFVNEASGRIESAKSSALGAIELSASSAIGEAGTTKAQTQKQVETEKSDAITRAKNYIAQARQALSESRLGVGQRYGTGSQLGRALGEYATVNFQKMAGQSEQTLESTMSKLNTLWENAQQNYATTVSKINAWKASAISEAEQNFINSLNSLSEYRTGNKIALLSSYRDKVDAIKTTAWTYALQAQQNAKSQQSQIETYLQQLASNYGTQSSGIGTANATDVANMNYNPLETTSGSTNQETDILSSLTGSTTKKTDENNLY